MDQPASVFRKDVDLVVVAVTVLDRSQRSVTGLMPEQFSVFEDKTSQRLRYFSNEDEPIALAVVLDASASMAARFERARDAVSELISTSNANDEFRVIVVGDTPRIALDQSDAVEDFQRALALIQPDGQTALWDSMVLALNGLRSAPFQRKAMVVISDGGDNHSRTTEQGLKSILKEAGVETYAIGLYDPFASRKEEKIGPSELDDLTSVTGGRLISVRDHMEMLGAVKQIGRELRDQYVLGYYPSHAGHDGRWHKIKVTLNADPISKPLRIFAKKGYFQPSD